MTAFEYADLALQHFQFAGLLALNFALVTALYLTAVWQLSGRLRGVSGFLVHTLFFGWQSNVAYLAVVTLHAGRQCLLLTGSAMPPSAWAAAPWLVPGSAVLYGSVLALCIAFALAGSRRAGSATATR